MFIIYSFTLQYVKLCSVFQRRHLHDWIKAVHRTLQLGLKSITSTFLENEVSCCCLGAGRRLGKAARSGESLTAPVDFYATKNQTPAALQAINGVIQGRVEADGVFVRNWRYHSGAAVHVPNTNPSSSRCFLQVT